MRSSLITTLVLVALPFIFATPLTSGLEALQAPGWPAQTDPKFLACFDGPDCTLAHEKWAAATTISTNLSDPAVTAFLCDSESCWVDSFQASISCIIAISDLSLTPAGADIPKTAALAPRVCNGTAGLDTVASDLAITVTYTGFPIILPEITLSEPSFQATPRDAEESQLEGIESILEYVNAPQLASRFPSTSSAFETCTKDPKCIGAGKLYNYCTSQTEDLIFYCLCQSVLATYWGPLLNDCDACVAPLLGPKANGNNNQWATFPGELANSWCDNPAYDNPSGIALLKSQGQAITQGYNSPVELWGMNASGLVLPAD